MLRPWQWQVRTQWKTGFSLWIYFLLWCEKSSRGKLNLSKLKKEPLQTTRSKESLIEFISAEKVAWDNLAAHLGDGFLPFPMGIYTDFSTFLISLFWWGSGTTSHQKNYFESKNHYLIPNSWCKNWIRNLGFFRLQTT